MTWLWILTAVVVILAVGLGGARLLKTWPAQQDRFPRLSDLNQETEREQWERERREGCGSR